MEEESALRAVARSDDDEFLHALYVLQKGLSGRGMALFLESANGDVPAVVFNRPIAGLASDIFQVQYLGQRGLYANEVACARARSTVANQYAFRAQSHASAGVNQEIGSLALSDNTDMLVTKVNGDTTVFRDLIIGRNLVFSTGATILSEPSSWLTAPLGTSITAQTAVLPSTQLAFGRVFFRGSIAWVAATIAGGSTLLTVAAAHRPATVKTFSIRTSATSAVASILDLNPDGTLTNGTSFGTTTSARMGLDGLSYDLS